MKVLITRKRYFLEGTIVSRPCEGHFGLPQQCGTISNFNKGKLFVRTLATS